MSGPSIHATCLLVGAKGVLIRGAPGAGKSRLALALIDDAARRGRFARLVGDDRVVLEAAGGRLVARAPAGIAGLIERRGLGIERVAFEPAAVLALVADIVADDALERLPEEASRRTVLACIALARLAVPGDPARAVPLVEAALAALPER